ncbi:hypothetical protein [Ruegeria arenilitoris]|uniref:hypothetical protein n=1 Tax=Ruegeria arenilitoris TaxID=1173585 RepID=UPI00147C7CCE|nr:hypothetical protein [Ruegeria arenilitoris]
MTRNMSAAFEAALDDPNLKPCAFFEGQFPSGTIYLWTGKREVTWNGQIWLGAGSLISASEIEETTDVIASGLELTISGVPSSMVSLVIDDARQGMPGKVYIGLLATDGSVIADPVQSFAGRLDVPNIEDGEQTCHITITYESRLIDLQRPREFRYTHESQRLFDPSDRGFEAVTWLQDRSISWGQ